MNDFIELVRPDGQKARYDLPIERRVVQMQPVRTIALFIGFVSLFAIDDIYDRYKYYGDGSVSLCHRAGQGNAPCYAYSIWFLVIFIVLIIAMIFAMISTFRRNKELKRMLGPHLRIDGRSFWCDQLAKPILFDEIETVSKLHVPSYGNGLDFRLKVPVSLASGRRWGWGTGKKGAFMWVPKYFDDPIDIVDVTLLLFSKYKSGEGSKI